MEIALYQPEIAPNVGTLIRLGACMNVTVHIIEPCGFPFGAKDLRRAVMDYANIANVIRHSSWDRFERTTKLQRHILLTTKSSICYTDFQYRNDDILLLGQESSGVPDNIHKSCEGSVTIPMRQDARSINMAVATAMVLGEALRQTGGFPTA